MPTQIGGRAFHLIVYVLLAWFGANNTFAQIAQVQLVSPAPNATDVAPCVTLDWNPASGATGYDYEVKQGATVVRSGGSGGFTTIDLTLSESTVYTWRVRGRTSQNDGPWSNPRTFTTKGPISAPGLSAPGNGQNHVGLNVTLQWGQVGDATGYDYEVYQNAVLVSSGGIADGPNPSVAVTLSEETFSWRVRGKTSCRLGTWSGLWAFTIPPIPAPVQVSPANGATGINLKPDLQWQSAAAGGAQDYDYEVYLGATLVASGSTGSVSVTVPTVLAENTTYTWRVRGKTSARNGLWSSLWSFTTKPPLAAPVLTSPANNADGVGLSPVLNWQAVVDAEGYDYEILQNGVAVVSGSGQPGSTASLTSHGVYDWRVRAKTTLRTGLWSATWNFATHPPIAAPVLISPANGETNVSLAVTLRWNSAPNAPGYDYELYQGATLIGAGSTNVNLEASFIVSENTQYSWRVRGKSSQRIGSWSSFWTFTTKPPIPPPTLISPVNYAANLGQNVTFNWQPLADAEGYNIEILQNNVPIIQTNHPPPLTLHLPTPGVYGWRVQGKTTLRTGAWSPTQIFGTEYLHITTQPQSQTVASGTPVTLSVVAFGAGTLSYQWRLNGQNIAHATNSSYAILNAQPTDGGDYSVMVAAGSSTLTSSEAAVRTASPTLSLADSFANRVTLTGATGMGSGNNASATHEPGDLDFMLQSAHRSVWAQWTAPADGVATFSTRGSSFDTFLAVFAGTNRAVLEAIDDDSGDHFTSRVNFVTSASTTYVIEVDGLSSINGDFGDYVLMWGLITNTTPTPVITEQPADQSAPLGGSATFNVVAVANMPTFYQWYTKGLPIPGATGPSLTITNVSALATIDSYHVVITAVGGQTASSRDAWLQIGLGSPSPEKPHDIITHNADFASVAAGSSGSQTISGFNSTTAKGEAIHSDTVGGSSRWYSLQAAEAGTMAVDTMGSDIDTTIDVWHFSANWIFQSPITSDNNSAPDGIRSRVSFQAARTNRYLIRVDGVNGAQGVININYALGVPPAPSGAPTNQFVGEGSNLILQAGTVNAVPAPTFQWYRNNGKIAGATNATFSLLSAQFNEVGDYSVIVSNLLGVVTNHIALVTMQAPLRLGWDDSTGGASLRVGGSSTQAVMLRFSTNLLVWTPVHTNPTPLLPVNFLDTNATKRPYGFYQLKPWP